MACLLAADSRSPCKENIIDIFKPRGTAAIRPPTSDKQQNGTVYNQPRFAHFGGLSGPSKVGKTGMAVQKPGDGKKVI